MTLAYLYLVNFGQTYRLICGKFVEASSGAIAFYYIPKLFVKINYEFITTSNVSKGMCRRKCNPKASWEAKHETIVIRNGI